MKTTLLSLLLLASFCFGFSQTHTYKFNGSFSEIATGPALSEVLATAPCAGTAGSFTTGSITTSAGTCVGGAPTQIFAFNDNDGVAYQNATGLGITGTYTINIVYKLNDYTVGAFGFQKLIDFSNGTTDDGVYSYTPASASLCLVDQNGPPIVPLTLAAPLSTTSYSLITLVRNGATNLMDIYVDGVAVLSAYNDVAGKFSSNGTSPIVFFRDDISATTPCESGAGTVKFISLSNATSTAGDVANTWSGLCTALFVTLPINLTNFSAQKNSTNALLQWQTATDVNTAYFNVERSYDGVSFAAINKVNAKGLSSNTYSYTDVAGLSSSSSNTYYRLKIVDNIGNYKYSSVVRLANGRETKIGVFPNPATDNITISGLKTNDIIKLLSIDGKVLSQQTSTVQSMIMSIEKYKPGTYIIQVQSDKELTQQKIIKY